MAKHKQTESTSAPEIMADVNNAANGEGIYRATRKLKSVKGNPAGSRLLCVGFFRSREEAMKMAERELGSQLAKKIILTKES